MFNQELYNKATMEHIRQWELHRTDERVTVREIDDIYNDYLNGASKRTEVTQSQFNKMGYQDRLELKQNDYKTFQRLNGKTDAEEKSEPIKKNLSQMKYAELLELKQNDYKAFQEVIAQ